MHFELQGLNTEKGQGEIPVALRRFFKPIEPTQPRPPQAGSVQSQARTRRNEGAQFLIVRGLLPRP